MNAVTKPKHEVATVEHARNALTPMELLDRAITSGAAPEVLGKMMELQERFDAGQNRKAFDVAMAAAQAEMPAITKDKTVDFTSQKGRTTYKHATLGNIEKTVKPVLARHGLHYRYNTKSEPERMTVTCIVAHRAGHFEENTLSGPLDTSGNKNSLQSIGSTQSYLQRYTLMAALGLGASEDDDGKAAGTGETITDEQVQEISTLLTKTKSDLVRFLKKIQLGSLTEIGADKFDDVIKLINDTAAKRAAVAKEPA